MEKSVILSGTSERWERSPVHGRARDFLKFPYDVYTIVYPPRKPTLMSFGFCDPRSGVLEGPVGCEIAAKGDGVRQVQNGIRESETFQMHAVPNTNETMR